MKILYYIESPIRGGTWEVLSLLAIGAAERGHQVAVAHHPQRELQPLLEALRQRGVHTVALQVRGERDLRGYWRFARLVRREGTGVVHVVRHMPLVGNSAIFAARLAGVPVVVASENLPFHVDRQVTRMGYRRALKRRMATRLTDRVIAVSEAVRRSFLGHHGIGEDKVVTIYNGIDLSRFSALPSSVSDTRRKAGFPATGLLVGTVAALAAQKGLPYLVRAAAQVVERIPETHFVIVGEGAMRAELEQEANALGIADSILFAGHRDDIPSLLAAFDLFVLPSLWEGFGLVVAEAMAAGKPVVATSVDSLPEIVVDGETGVLVPPRDPVALAQAIIRLLTEGEKAATMGLAGRRRAAERFSHHRMIDETLALYRQLLAAKGAGP